MVAKRSLGMVLVATVVAAAFLVSVGTGGVVARVARSHAEGEVTGFSSKDSKHSKADPMDEIDDLEADADAPTPAPTGAPTPVPSPKVNPADFYKEETEGEGLHASVAEGLGTCGFGSFDPQGLKAVALNHGDLAGNKACGMCIKVISAKDLGGEAVFIEGKTFFVNNEVYGKHGDVAFDIEETEQRGVTIKWKAVPCPITDSIQYQLLHPSGYYVAAKPMGMIYPVVKMELKVEGKWETGHLDGSGYLFSWNNDKGQFRFPLDVRLTSVNGQVIEDVIKHLSEKRQPGTGKQFKAPKPPPAPSPPPSAPSAECAGEGENCYLTKCCATEGTQCFAKNAEWAQCKEKCVPGKDPTDPKEFRTPWSCDLVAGATAAAPAAPAADADGCTETGGDCRASRCCASKHDTCYEKDSEWAACKKACEPGKHDDDPKDYRTPWTCNILLGTVRK